MAKKAALILIYVIICLPFFWGTGMFAEVTVNSNGPRVQSSAKPHAITFLKTRRISTCNQMSPSFIYVDHQHGFIFTSFEKKSGHTLKFKKIKRFRKAIQTRRISDERIYRLIETDRCVAERQNDAVTGNIRSFAFRQEPGVKSWLNDLFSRMNPVFII